MTSADNPRLDFGSSAWLEGLTAACQALGTIEFEQELYLLLNNNLQIDHFVVFTYSEEEGPGHLFTRSKMPEEEAQALAKDYVDQFYERDPQLSAVKQTQTDSETHALHPELNSDYDDEYQDHFFTQHSLIDKVSTVGKVETENVYCNFYRMGGSEPYSDDDRKLFDSVLPVITSLISNHYKLLRLTETEVDEHEGNVARSMVHSVISRQVEPFNRLTARESEICERILIGMTSTGISLDLGIATSSVNTYRRRAYEKLEIATQNELFSLCLLALSRIKK